MDSALSWACDMREYRSCPNHSPISSYTLCFPRRIACLGLRMIGGMICTPIWAASSDAMAGIYWRRDRWRIMFICCFHCREWLRYPSWFGKSNPDQPVGFMHPHYAPPHFDGNPDTALFRSVPVTRWRFPDTLRTSATITPRPRFKTNSASCWRKTPSLVMSGMCGIETTSTQPSWICDARRHNQTDVFEQQRRA